MKKFTALSAARAAIVAALYAVLTLFFPLLSYGPLQLRVGEGMTLLPLLFPETAIGLTIGCLAANFFSPYAWYDIVFGTFATLIAAALTYLVGRAMKEKSLMSRGLAGAVPPVFVNALILPLVWLLSGSDAAYFLNFGLIVASQSAACVAIGIPLLFAVKKLDGLMFSGSRQQGTGNRKDDFK